MAKRLALLICNSEYESLPKLRTPVHNGEKLESILNDFGGFSEVIFLKNENCTNIKRSISNFLKNADGNDEILIYFSGHGALSHEFLLTGVDTPKDEPDIASVSKSFIFHKINNSLAKQFLIIIDSCFSGGMSKIPEQVSTNKKIEILTSSGAIEYSYEPVDDLNSLYTYFTKSIIDIIESRNVGNSVKQFLSAKDIYDILDNNRTIEKSAPKYRATAVSDSNSFRVVKNLLFENRDEDKTAKQKDTTVSGILYLDWLLREHSYLKLHGIHSAHNFKGVALEHIYVALRGEKSSSYEKVKAKNLAHHHAVYLTGNEQDIDEELLYELELDYLQDNPVLPSILKEDKIPSEYDIPITIGEAFIDERFLIILGDPGSGKTTLAKWLAIQLARTYKEVLQSGISKNVEILESKVDPYMDIGNVTYNLGPARFPILLSIADYAQTFSESYPKKEISIIEYIGTHKWRGKSPCYANDKEISPIKLRAVFEYFLKKGEAVVILDGMDEVTKNRKEIVFQIQEFISKWIIYKGDDKISINIDIDWKNYTIQKPGITGGNQVVITSRIVGYHLSPITKSITHVTIEPMKKKAIGRFCDMWMDELHRMEYNSLFPENTILELAEKQAIQLKNAIFNDRQILELATNPLLITIIALVYRNNNGHLPSHRAALYQEALVTLIETWKQPSLSINEVEYVLSAVAQTIHIKYPKGIIKETELTSIIEKNLALYRGREIKDMPANFAKETVAPFIEEIRNKVGIIAPRGDKVYGFIHLTFQEYLTARYLTKDKYKTIEQIAEYLDNPRWKVPLMMALGHISVNKDWDSKLVSNVLNAILDSDSKLSQFFPRSALLLSHAFAEMSLEKVDTSVIKRVIFSLLKFYHHKERINPFPKLKRRIERGFILIKRSEKGEIIEQVFYNLLTNPTQEQIHLVPVSVTILYENRWFSKRIVQALYKAIRYDSSEWGWIINRTLTKLVSDQLAIPKPEEPKRPDSPKIKFEKAIEDYKSDLEKLLSNELALTTEVKIEVDKLYAELPISRLKSEISILSQIERIWSDEIEENYRIIEKILDYSFEKDIKKAKEVMSNIVGGIEKNEKNDIKYRRYEYMIQNEYLDVLDKVLYKIQAGKVTNEINYKVDKLKEYVQKTKRDNKELLEKLKKLSEINEFTQFQKDLSKIRFNKNKFYAYSSIDQLDERIEKTRYLCYVLLNPTDYDLSLGKIATEFTIIYDEKEQELKRLQKRLQNIESGKEKDIIINKINNVKEKIKGEHFSTVQYKEEWRKYNFTYQYYEDALEKYQEQQVHNFKEYQLNFQNQDISLISFREYYLFTIFWGGYKNSSQIEIWKKYDETAMFLQKADVERDFMVENNPYYYYGKYSFDDTIYNAAVCLDTNTIKLDDFRILPKKKELKPIFSKNLIFRKPALSTEIINQNKNYQNLNFIINHSFDSNEIIDAVILKAFTQNNSKDAINTIASSNYENEVINKLKAIQITLEDAVFASFPMIFTELKQLSKVLPVEEWFEIYRKLYSVLLKARKSAYLIKDLLEIAPEKYKSVILADHWYTTSTTSQDDIVYEFAVMLDTCSKPEWAKRIKSAFLQISIAPTFHHRKYLDANKDWIVSSYISSDIFRKDEIPIDVLSAIENYGLFNDIRADLSKSFQEVYLNRLVKELIPDNHPQKFELILFCLQNSFFENGLEDFLPSNTRSINYIQNELLPKIIDEEDDYYKSRALIRFLPYARNQEKTLSKLLGCFKEIRDPFEKAQVYVLLKKLNIFTNTKEIDDLFDETIVDIQNPLQRIKVIVDGYSLISNNVSINKLHDLLLQSIEEIEDMTLKGRITNLLIKSGINLKFKNKLKQHISNSKNGIFYNVGLDLFGLDILLNEKTLKEQKQNPENWTPVLLYAAIDDIVNFFSPPQTEQSITDLWNNLIENPISENTKPLLIRGIENGLELIPKAVEVINNLYTKANIDLLTPLYPLLQCTNGNALLSVEQWMNSSDDDLKNYASLYHAEFHNKINAENIDGLLTLRLSLDSRTYCRVNIVLSQGILNVKRHLPRKYKLSSLLEIPFLIKMVEAVNIEKKFSTKKSLISFFFSDLELDSVSLVNKILEKESLRTVFEHSNDLTIEVEESIASLIASANFNANELLESMIHLVIQNFCEHEYNKQRIYKKIHKVIIEKYQERLKQYKFIPQNVFTLLEAFQKAKEKTLDNVKNLVENKKIGLDEIISSGYEENKNIVETGLLRAYGYHYNKNYIFRNTNEIIKIKEFYSDDIFEFFIEWFLHEASKSKNKNLNLDNTLDLTLILIAIWVDEKNVSILNSFDKDGNLYKSLLEAIQKTSVAGVLACINVLRYIHQHSQIGIELLLQKINSRPHIQIAAIQTLNSIKNIDENSLSYIFNRVLESDPLSSSIYVSILSNYANDSNTKSVIRKSIVSALTSCLDDERSKCGIYQFNHSLGSVESPIKIQYVGRLDEFIFKAILGIVDI